MYGGGAYSGTFGVKIRAFYVYVYNITIQELKEIGLGKKKTYTKNVMFREETIVLLIAKLNDMASF